MLDSAKKIVNLACFCFLITCANFFMSHVGYKIVVNFKICETSFSSNWNLLRLDWKYLFRLLLFQHKSERNAVCVSLFISV